MRDTVDRHLRKMRNANHLVLARHFCKLPPHRTAHFATDVGIDFVEHHNRDSIMARQHRLGRQHDTRDFSARGNGAQRSHRLAHVGRKSKFDVIQAREMWLRIAQFNRE